MRRSTCLLAAFLAAACAGPIPEQPPAEQPLPAEARIAASELQLFHSERAGTRYLVSIALPDPPVPTRVPVVYVIGEGDSFTLVTGISRLLARGGDVRAALIVGVERSDRRELDVARLHAFLTDELAPFIATRYPVGAERILVGDRGGAAFALHVLFEAPRTFDGYLIDPGSWPTDDRTMQREAAYAAHEHDLPARVFLATGGLDPDAARIEELTRLLRERRYPRLTIETVILHGETEHSAVPAALSRGLRFLLDSRHGRSKGSDQRTPTARDATSASTSDDV